MIDYIHVYVHMNIFLTIFMISKRYDCFSPVMKIILDDLHLYLKTQNINNNKVDQRIMYMHTRLLEQ